MHLISIFSQKHSIQVFVSTNDLMLLIYFATPVFFYESLSDFIGGYFLDNHNYQFNKIKKPGKVKNSNTIQIMKLIFYMKS